jgi:hypothetical protein
MVAGIMGVLGNSGLPGYESFATVDPDPVDERRNCLHCRGTGTCQVCQGSGDGPGPSPAKCQRCGGSGKCPACQGTGLRRG